MSPGGRRLGMVAVLAALATVAPAAGAQQTRAERSSYLETSTYADVITFLDSLQLRGARIRVGTLATSAQGRTIPYVIASRPLVSTPAEARRLGRPIVYLQGNIHAGEVEGKEALQALLRDLLFDPKPNVLDSLVLIVVPIYNPDGNEAWGPQAIQRAEQNGPEVVGQRANGMGLDLNRDYVKAEAPETRGALALFNAWDPDLFVDLHTTDGSYHGYALTYSPSLHPAAAMAGGPFGGAFVQDSLLPILRARMRARRKIETFDYGNFSGDDGPPPPSGEPRSWSSYDHRARFGTNYYGLRGRLAILSEAYAHDPMERRVASTYAFVREVLTLTAERTRSVLAVTRGSDAALAAGRVKEIPVRARIMGMNTKQTVIEEVLEPIPEARGAAELAPGTPCPWALTQPGVRCGMKRTGKFVRVTMPVRDRFERVRSVALPIAYTFAPDAAGDSLVAHLRRHGVVVEQVIGAASFRGAVFMVDSVVRSPTAYQGHVTVRLEGAWQSPERFDLPPGAYVVRTAQPLGVLAAELLEPQADDGFVTWNLLDAAAGKWYPVMRMTAPLAAPTRLLK